MSHKPQLESECSGFEPISNVLSWVSGKKKYIKTKEMKGTCLDKPWNVEDIEEMIIPVFNSWWYWLGT